MEKDTNQETQTGGDAEGGEVVITVLTRTANVIGVWVGSKRLALPDPVT